MGGPALETEVAKGGHLAVLPNGRLVVGIGDLDDQEPRFGTRWPPGAEPWFLVVEVADADDEPTVGKDGQVTALGDLGFEGGPSHTRRSAPAASSATTMRPSVGRVHDP